MRTAASVVAPLLLLAATRLTWYGVAAIIILAALLIDLLRRVSHIDSRVAHINDRLDEQHSTITDLKALVEGDGD